MTSTFDSQRDFAKALELRSDGRYVEALELLLPLQEQASESTSLFVVIGQIYWEQKSFDSAIAAFRRAVLIAPESETASLGLFHCLWDAGKQEEAIGELQRYLAVGESDEYQTILKSLAAHGQS